MILRESKIHCVGLLNMQFYKKKARGKLWHRIFYNYSAKKVASSTNLCNAINRMFDKNYIFLIGH